MTTQEDCVMDSVKMSFGTLAGGCFWCLEAVFEQVQGVEHVQSGYTGGHVQRPSYGQVCTGTTGHAEAVQVSFDPSVISFKGLLEIFFAIHDPTTLDRQGPDIGPQYRSAVFYHDAGQEKVAEEVMGELQAAGVWRHPIVTEVVPLEVFYPAEDYHNEYYRRNAEQPYCQVVIEPKLAKLRQKHLKKLKGVTAA
jgi:peptide-methionine (S)-S-oxide reductase